MEYVIISGKGGTGKTTLTASFVYLSENASVKADCDVDASNLHLMFQNSIVERSDFKGAFVAAIEAEKCTDCSLCQQHCRFNAIEKGADYYRVNPLKCEGCGVCEVVCPSGAVDITSEITGDVIHYDSEIGGIIGAELIPGAEGSGKLVTEVRKKANQIKQDEQYTLIDGSPGIGCAVMASITGCDYGVVVTEPTLSGVEDFRRVRELLVHFNVKPLVVINKCDINLDVTQQIEWYCSEKQVEFLGKIPFDKLVETSINEGKPIVTYKDSPAGDAIRDIWIKLETITEEIL